MDLPTADPQRRTYLIEEGDTLWDIAFYELGDASRWIELHRLNVKTLGPDPTDLKPGTWIELPAVKLPND